MLGKGRIALLVALCASLVPVTAAGGDIGGPVPNDRYWLGTHYAGLELNGPVEPGDRAYSYGDCELPEGEGGCSVPVQIQNWTSCSRNPIGLDVLPIKVFLVRGGGLAAAYEPTAVDIGTGTETVSVFSNEVEMVPAVLRDIHTRSQVGPEPLAPPVYPLPVLRELKRVTALAGRLGVKGIVRETGLHPQEVKLRLRVARLLGPDALAGVKPPTMSIETVERLRQLSFKASFDFARTARRNGLTKAQLRKKVNLVRGLGGGC
jgi:hypothetical protein